MGKSQLNESRTYGAHSLQTSILNCMLWRLKRLISLEYPITCFAKEAIEKNDDFLPIFTLELISLQLQFRIMSKVGFT